MMPHPEINKAKWTNDHILAAKTEGRGFPVNTKLEAIKYKYSSTNTADIPFTCNLWSSKESKESGKVNLMTIEVEFNKECEKFTTIDNLRLLIPLGVASKPKISKQENSKYNYLDKEHKVEWIIEKLNESHPTATIEIITSSEPDSMFPIDVDIRFEYSIIGADIVKVIERESGNPINYAMKKELSTESFQIVKEI